MIIMESFESFKPLWGRAEGGGGSGVLMAGNLTFEPQGPS